MRSVILCIMPACACPGLGATASRLRGGVARSGVRSRCVKVCVVGPGVCEGVCGCEMKVCVVLR